MALIKCPECGREISDKAESCPHCGCPTPRTVRPHVQAEETTVWSGNPLMFRGQPGIPVALAIVVFACIVMFAAGPEAAGGGGFFLFLVLLYLPVWFLECKSKRLTVTNYRTILRRGILSKRTTEVRHVDVRVVNVGQGILQRLFGTGRLSVGSAGHAGMEISITGIGEVTRVAAMIRERQGT